MTRRGTSFKKERNHPGLLLLHAVESLHEATALLRNKSCANVIMSFAPFVLFFNNSSQDCGARSFHKQAKWRKRVATCL